MRGKRMTDPLWSNERIEFLSYDIASTYVHRDIEMLKLASAIEGAMFEIRHEMQARIYELEAQLAEEATNG